MSVFSDHDPQPPMGEEPYAPASRWPIIAGAVAIACVLLGAAWWLSRPAPITPAPSTVPAVRESVPAPDVAPKADAPVPVAEPARPTTRRERPPRERPAAPVEPEAPAAPVGPTLVVESDVPGASVFLNRKYLGTTPLRSTEVTAGAGQLNVSAEGYDGVARSVQIEPSGVTEVTVRLKEVRLDASVAVVHKHAMGSCEGTLRATVEGLRYDTPNKGDAFALPFAQVETFSFDYLQKALRVKQRGAKTWNFTTKDDSADPLFVFHRDVEKARQKLAGK